MSTLTVQNLRGISPTNLITVASGHKIYSPGSIVQVKSATSGFTNQTINSATPVALTGMSVTITPVYATSVILIQAALSASWTYVSSVHIYKNGSDLISNHGGNNQSSGGTALWTKYFPYTTDSTSDIVFTMPVLYQDSPATTSSTTYAIYANSGWSGGNNAFYFNNRSGLDMLSSSWMTVMEIAQ